MSLRWWFTSLSNALFAFWHDLRQRTTNHTKLLINNTCLDRFKLWMCCKSPRLRFQLNVHFLLNWLLNAIWYKLLVDDHQWCWLKIGWVNGDLLRNEFNELEARFGGEKNDYGSDLHKTYQMLQICSQVGAFILAFWQSWSNEFHRWAGSRVFLRTHRRTVQTLHMKRKQ